jgi:3-isopropylmalate dehydrogenase
MTQYKIPVLPGDGIGPEIIAEGRKVIDAAGERFGFDVEWIEYPHGAVKDRKKPVPRIPASCEPS